MYNSSYTGGLRGARARARASPRLDLGAQVPLRRQSALSLAPSPLLHPSTPLPIHPPPRTNSPSRASLRPGRRFGCARARWRWTGHGAPRRRCPSHPGAPVTTLGSGTVGALGGHILLCTVASFSGGSASTPQSPITRGHARTRSRSPRASPLPFRHASLPPSPLHLLSLLHPCRTWREFREDGFNAGQ
jgi:hypothetical protein